MISPKKGWTYKVFDLPPPSITLTTIPTIGEHVGVDRPLAHINNFDSEISTMEYDKPHLVGGFNPFEKY